MDTWIDWANRNQGILTLSFSAVVMAATVTYAVLTWVLVRETTKLRKAETEPNIAIYVEPEEKSPAILDMVVRNFGSGAAYDLRFRFDPPEYRHERIFIWDVAVFNGLEYMAPATQHRLLFGSAIELLGDNEPQPFTVTVSYRGASGIQRSEPFTISVAHLHGMQVASESTERDVDKALKQIASDLRSVVGYRGDNKKGVRVDIGTAHAVSASPSDSTPPVNDPADDWVRSAIDYMRVLLLRIFGCGRSRHGRTDMDPETCTRKR